MSWERRRYARIGFVPATRFTNSSSPFGQGPRPEGIAHRILPSMAHGRRPASELRGHGFNSPGDRQETMANLQQVGEGPARSPFARPGGRQTIVRIGSGPSRARPRRARATPCSAPCASPLLRVSLLHKKSVGAELIEPAARRPSWRWILDGPIAVLTGTLYSFRLPTPVVGAIIPL